MVETSLLQLVNVDDPTAVLINQSTIDPRLPVMRDRPRFHEVNGVLAHASISVILYVPSMFIAVRICRSSWQLGSVTLHPSPCDTDLPVPFLTASLFTAEMCF